MADPIEIRGGMYPPFPAVPTIDEQPLTIGEMRLINSLNTQAVQEGFSNLFTFYANEITRWNAAHPDKTKPTINRIDKENLLVVSVHQGMNAEVFGSNERVSRTYKAVAGGNVKGFLRRVSALNFSDETNQARNTDEIDWTKPALETQYFQDTHHISFFFSHTDTSAERILDRYNVAHSGEAISGFDERENVEVDYRGEYTTVHAHLYYRSKEVEIGYGREGKLQTIELSSGDLEWRREWKDDKPPAEFLQAEEIEVLRQTGKPTMIKGQDDAVFTVTPKGEVLEIQCYQPNRGEQAGTFRLTDTIEVPFVRPDDAEFIDELGVKDILTQVANGHDPADLPAEEDTEWKNGHISKALRIKWTKNHPKIDVRIESEQTVFSDQEI